MIAVKSKFMLHNVESVKGDSSGYGSTHSNTDTKYDSEDLESSNGDISFVGKPYIEHSYAKNELKLRIVTCDENSVPDSETGAQSCTDANPFDTKKVQLLHYLYLT
mmetsp:Transcript_3028/g.2872  ORF Transcript_3028/g.2872 Transcript_3028/m.2872 type:complete len:106 (+) Transcript_3028:1-318(+)|eukprot:CAMPEP_0197738236 /NCGR_PEP_ID=MMETSP1435-20131217/13550_1 /TAXON_ID=426625 /ORGANISM="Chaetoceros brevis, Strain CCMP164" /LENGTH=105 /DNA_ID=CAMNT_0043327057 /DNA_START=1 /DNA_END=314 /DNA_ORIENTATION=+